MCSSDLEKDDDRIIDKAILLECADDFADAVVQVRQHGGKDPSVDVLDMVEFLHVPVSPLQWTVDSVIGQVQEEGSVAGAVDKVHRFTSQRVGEIGRASCRERV